MLKIIYNKKVSTSRKNQASIQPPLKPQTPRQAYTLKRRSTRILSMDHREQLQDVMNRTRALEALSLYLNNPRKTVIRIEAFVAVAAVMLFLQLILGPWRRRSSHWFVQGTLWLAYTLSFPLITYTLGQMVSSPVKNGLYPIWAILLFWTAGCTNGITAYSLEDNKQWKRYLFELFQYVAYFSVIVELLKPTHQASFKDEMTISQQPVVILLSFLSVMIFFNNLIRLIAGWMVTNSSPSKLVADYMRVQVGARGAQEPSDPSTMEGYRYVVRPPFHDRFSTGQAITIKEIWDIDDSLLNTHGGGSQFKYVCLSFALSHLLRCRFFEMDCTEAGLAETRKFALEVLLSEENQVNHYSQPFHIIEVELGFLYDFFFTKYAALFDMEGQFLIMVVLKLICTSICGAFLLGNSPIIKTLDPIIEVGTRRVDVTITIVVLGVLLLLEALQAILYLTSDWATVSLACSYTRRDTPSLIWFLRRFNLSRYWRSMMAQHKFGKFLISSSRKMFGKILNKLNLFGYWQNKMGQSSVIEGCLHVNLFYVIPMRINTCLGLIQATGFSVCYIFGFIHAMIFSKKKFEVVPDLVKTEIVSCLRKYSKVGPLTNGEAALHRNLVKFEEFSRTLKNHSQTRVMLIWHIATEYCNIASSDEAEVHQSDAQQVATTLSKYCAYLMSFVPELLPGNSTDTLFIFNDVLLEGTKKLRKGKLSRDGLLKVINDSESSSSSSNEDQTIVHDSEGYDNNDTTVHIPSSRNNEDTIIDDSSVSNNDHIIDQDSTTNNNEGIFIKGLKLGRDLEKIPQVLRWKVLAEFWVETIIYIAPSDKVDAHMERLAQGGEFLTHVWALLTHAGIMKRDQKQTPEDIV